MTIDGETVESVTDFIYLDSKITVDSDFSHEIKIHLLFAIRAMTNLDSVLKKERHCFANKGLYNQSYGFSSSHVWAWELDHKESWTLKNWCFLTVVLEETLERSLDSKKFKTVNPKGNQILNIHWKDMCWSWTSNTLATWCEELTHRKKPWCWERLKVGGEGGKKGWDGWMALST